MRSLNLFLIHSPSAKYRENSMNNTCKLIEMLCQKNNYKYRQFKITSHEPAELKLKLKELEETINYDKIGDEDFDRLIATLNLEQLSNIMKQKEALKQISNLSKLPTITKEDLFMIMEDDALVLPDFQKNIEAFFQTLDNTTWDLLSLSVSLPGNIAKTGLVDIRSITKILPGKEAYFIQPNIAQQLYDSFKTLKFTFRVHLSHWLYTHPHIRAKGSISRVMIEGSKVGFFPSTATDNNILIYNQEFMDMFKMMVQQIPYDFQKVKQCYKTIEHIKSPDAMHLYAVILHKEGKMDQAKELFLEAMNEMYTKNGLVSGRSELLNNTINIHGVVQEDYKVATKELSKYASVKF